MVKMKTLGGTADAMFGDVTVKAMKRGSYVSRVGIIHVDNNKKAHPQAQKRSLPADVADAMEAQGLVKVLKSVTLEGEEAAIYMGENLDALALQRRQDGAMREEEHPFLNSGADTRDTTAFATRPLLNTGARAVDAAAAAGAGSPDAVGSSTVSEGSMSHASDENGDHGQEGGEGDAAGGDAPPLDGEDGGTDGTEGSAPGTEQQHQTDRAPRRAGGGKAKTTA
jgi:hypothetical protein